MERNKTVDALKGYAIILVVFGHAIQHILGPNTAYDNTVFRFIYSFHMPLFMFLSGYIIFGKVPKLWSKWLWKSSRRLLIPFFIWFLIWSVNSQFDFIHFAFINGLSGVQAHFFKGLTDNIFDTPWFLMVLFMFYLILLMIKYLEKYTGYFIYIWIFLIIYIQPIHHLWIINLQWYYPFFFGGYLIAKNQNSLPIISAETKLLFCGLFILLYFLLPNWIGTPNGWVILPGQWALNILIAFLGIAASYFLIDFLCNKRISRLFSHLGLYTLDIYVLHAIFLGWCFGNFSTLFFRLDLGIYSIPIFMTLFALSLSYVTSWIIRRSPLLKFVLLGDKS